MKKVGNTLRTEQVVRVYPGKVNIDDIVKDLEKEFGATLQAKNKNDTVNGSVATIQVNGDTEVVISFYLEDSEPEEKERGRKTRIEAKPLPHHLLKNNYKG